MTQAIALTLSSASVSDTYSWTMVDWAGGTHAFSFASTGVPATDAATMVGLINAATMSPVSSSGTTPPVVTLTGTPTANAQIVIQITAGGVGTAAVFKWSSNGGTSFTTGVSVAAAVALIGTGLVANFAVSPPDTYALNNLYTANSTLGFAVAVSAAVTVTQVAGQLVDIQKWNPSQTTTPIISLADNTTDPGIATDLAAIQSAAPPGSYYGIALDSNSAAEITGATAFAESAGLDLLLFNNSDTACITTATTDIFSSQKALAHARSGGLYSGTSVLSGAGLAWLAKTLPSVPGSLTFMYKTLAGVPADNLSQTAQINLTAKSGNFYIPVAGVNITVNGWDSAGEFLDQVWGTDALTNTIQTNVLAGDLAGLPKVSYTDLGVAGIISVVQAALLLFSDKQHNFLATNPAPVATAPLVATLSSTQRASRSFRLKASTVFRQICRRDSFSDD